LAKIFNPGSLELIVGPMRSGKNNSLISRISPIQFTDYTFIAFNPDINIRDNGLVSRTSSWNHETYTIPSSDPEICMEHALEYDVIVFTEAHFFSKKLTSIVEKLIKQNKNVIVCGLDMDFRSEPFSALPDLLARANIVTKLTAVCTFQENGKICGREATRTQRYINNEPAPYDSPIILVGDFHEGYEPHCVHHHVCLKENPIIQESEKFSFN
jgi:thymidine kinase